MQQELHVLHLAAVVAELLENVDAVGVDMAAVLQRVKISGVGALPSQHDIVGVVLVAHLGVGGQCGGVGDAHGAVGIAPLHAVGVNALRLVDLAQTRLGHADGHGVGGIIVGHGEFAGILRPSGDLIGAASVLEELDDYILLIVTDALGHGIDVSILTQAGRLGGNSGQGADDLIVDHITH